MGRRSKFNPVRLRDLRLMKGLTAEEFAAKIKKTARTLSNWEAGVTSPTMHDLERICREFDVDLASFLQVSESKKIGAT